MDSLIRRFDAVKDRDLMVCAARGVAYQRDMSKPVEYGEAYFQHYVEIEGGEIARRLNAGRVALVDRHAGSDRVALDVGIGSGEFIQNRPNTVGIDVNPKALDWLTRKGKLGTGVGDYLAYTFWDVLEHVPEPNGYFKRMPDGAFLFASLPIYSDLAEVRSSKHYKPNEHFYYWTADGFVSWMAAYRFRLLEQASFETQAGREGIGSFAFVRDLPTYHDTLDQYAQIHSKAYGTSAYQHFEQIAGEVLALNPPSVLDFGCGRSDLIAHFWADGRRKIAKYDPAIPQFKRMPDGDFGLVICCDVMEHIPLLDVDRVLREIRAKSHKALFTISMKPARAKLPDGRNAHVSLLTASEWGGWIKDVFGKAVRLPTEWDHILMLKTF